MKGFGQWDLILMIFDSASILTTGGTQVFEPGFRQIFRAMVGAVLTGYAPTTSE